MSILIGADLMKEQTICKRCVMTTQGDPCISFDEKGFCNYCNDALKREKEIYFPNKEGQKKLTELLGYLKNKNKNKRYDCLMGISGGLDSCYLAYLGTVKWGLRIAAIHIDDGFDTEVSRENIKQLCEKCDIHIKYIKPDEQQYYQLCKAYMKAGVPNLAVPQDNVLFASIYKYAQEEKIPDFLSGGNFSLESILQGGNTIEPYDLVNIYDINRKFGTGKIDKLPFISKWSKNFIRYSRSVVTWAPLNYIEYEREKALKELNEFCNFQYYGSKHLENYYTGFLQLYWLPKKFNVDKRTSHFSSMIISGQMTREEALVELKKTACEEAWIQKAISELKEKLKLTDQEFEEIMASEPHQHTDYRYDKIFDLLLNIKKKICKNN